MPINPINPISLTKRYKCKACKEPYIKERVSQQVCGATCAIKLIELSRLKKARQAVARDKRETKAKLDAMAGKPELKKLLKTALHDYVRQRDYGKPCISCGGQIAWGSGTTGGVCDAGHYMSVGAHANLQFEPSNIHAQCKHCNSVKGKGGNYAEYRKGLIARCGLAHVEALECDNEPRKYSKDKLRELTVFYRAELKKLRL
jgi:Bacteriophage Lambda NinG protein